MLYDEFNDTYSYKSKWKCTDKDGLYDAIIAGSDLKKIQQHLASDRQHTLRIQQMHHHHQQLQQQQQHQQQQQGGVEEKWKTETPTTSPPPPPPLSAHGAAVPLPVLWGIPTKEFEEDLRRSFPKWREALDSLVSEGRIFRVKSESLKDHVLFARDLRNPSAPLVAPLNIDARVRKLWVDTRVPREDHELEEELKSFGLKPAKRTFRRQVEDEAGLSRNKRRKRKREFLEKLHEQAKQISTKNDEMPSIPF